MEVHQAGVSYQFLWSNEPVPPLNPKTEGTVSEAKFATPELLRTFLKAIGRGGQFRELLRRGTPGPHLWMDDESLQKALIEAIEKKKLKVIQRTANSGGGGTSKAKPAERVVMARRQGSNEPSYEPDPATFAGNHDGEAQAAALVAAAEQGLAICEECEKRRAAAAAAES